MRMLKIHSLPKAKHWIDRDVIMLHACFQILQDYIEKEEGDTHCCYEVHKEFVDEVRFLYNWWLKRKETICNENDHKDDDKEDDEMLARLMKIRTMLWT